jgi:hypothetical protein
LSTTSTPESNDPLYKDSFVPDPGTDLQPEPGITKVVTSTMGYAELINMVHAKLVTESSDVARRLPRAAFAYYCSVALYARLLFIHSENGRRTTVEEREFIQLVKNIDLQLPSLIGSYVNSFGNFTGRNGVDHSWEFPTDRPGPVVAGGVTGWYGRVSVDTHNWYEHYHNPAVTAWICTQEIAAFTAQQAGQAIVARPNLPDEVRCLENDEPNENLLGYSTVGGLRQEAVYTLLTANITAQAFPTSCDIPFNADLLATVSQYLATTKNGVSESIQWTRVGTLGQYPWERVAAGYRYTPGSLTLQRKTNLQQISEARIDGRISNAAAIFLLRFRKYVDNDQEVPGVEGEDGVGRSR